MNLSNKGMFLSNTLSVLLLTSSIVLADVSGIVFQDLPVNGTALNAYGLKDANEFGVGGITVTAYPDNISTTTDANGAWSLATTVDSRIEFSNIPSYLKESVEGGEKNASVQFVVNGEASSFALHNPADYSDTANPELVSLVYTGGKHDGIDPQDTMIVWNYSDTSDPAVGATIDTNRRILSSKSSLGTAWGIAYDKEDKIIYTSALLKRHSGLPNTSDDNNGDLGVIYTVDKVTNTTSEFYRFSDTQVGVIGDDETRGLGDYNEASTDADAFSKVGKVGLGDIDLFDDAKTLYAITLSDRKLNLIDVASKTLSSSVEIPTSQCSNSEDARPFALKYYEDKLYVGVVCSAESSQTLSDMEATVYAYDNNTFTEVINYALDYTKGSNEGDYIDSWHPWARTWDDLTIENTAKHRKYYPQPMLTDIEFAYVNGQKRMIMSFMDRAGHQIGLDNYDTSGAGGTVYDTAIGGDILIASVNTNGTFDLESNGAVGGSVASDEQKNNQGPGGGEFFYGDYFTGGHDEPMVGSIAYLPGSNAIIASSIDPVNTPSDSDGWDSGGVKFLSLDNGEHIRGYHLYGRSEEGRLNKANGIGDIELLLPPAPIEIGDRVWEDNNTNGVQDVNESGISGLSVELACGGAVVSTATTDTDGNYIFSNNPNGTSTESHKYNVIALVAGSDDCLVRIPNVQGDAKQSSLGDNVLSPANIGEGANSNINDSDGILNGDNAEINVTGAEIPVNGANNHSFDFGFSLPQKAKLGDFVWNDINKNGIQDEGESGVANVTAKVFKDCVGSELATTQTNPTGFYLFEDLEEGSYCVEFSDLPTDYLVSPANQNGDDEKDSDVDTSTLRTNSITLEAGDNNLSLDMGIYYGKASIGNFVWDDTNKNGVQDSGEIGVEGVLAVLYQGDCSTEINTTVTSETGFYLFDQLDAGEYCIGFKNIPSGYAITEKNATASTADNNSDVDPSTSKAVKTTLDEGENDMSWDMGIYQLASIGDKVWHDKNRDGLQDETEEGVQDVAVALLKDCTTVVANTTTDANGNYLFSNIEPANYCLEFSDIPDGYLVTTKDVGENNAIDSDVDSDTMQTVSVTVESGSADLSWDMGIYQLATIGDKVWYDNNGDGIQDGNETGVEGVKVELLKDCNTTISNKVTDSTGNYLFSDLEPASYCLKFSDIPTDYYITGADRTSDDQDSDVNPSTGLTIPTELLSGEDDRTWDMGISQFASIGNRVWLDSNANGIQDVNESGVSNVTVKLIENCGERGETVVDNMETDGTGHYLFSGVSPSNYCLEFSDLPVGAEISSADQGDDVNDSDVNPITKRTASTELNPGAVDERWDMGIYFPASVGDKVWHDLNANGLQDLNESGVADVTVTLYDGTCTTVATDKDGVNMPTVVTSATGAYLFDNLVPANYCIGFSDLPEGFVVTSRDINLSMDANDSDVNASTGTTAVLELRSNEQDMSWDLGIYQPATLGNLVWIDANKNGLQDDGNESGVEGVTVVLYDMNCSQEVNRTITDSNGTYLFSNLVPNEYCVQFSDLPTGYGITTQTVAMEENNDSDVNPSTKATPNTMLTSGEDDRSWDMGIYKRPVSTVITPFIPVSTATPPPTPAPSKACFGDRVWEDSNRDGIQNADEEGVKDIAVTLYQADCNTEINRTITDANGNYLFSDLEPAEYCVGFSDLPTDYTVTVKDRGASDLEDSDVNPETQKTDSFVLIGGEACDVSIDMGIYKETPMQELRIYDDLVSANTEGPVTTIPLLDNDAVGEGATVEFVNVEEGEIIWNDGTAVAGTNLSTSDELYVEGEGTWRVESDGTVSFTADDGFDGTPSPVYYIVKDEEGNQSNVAQLSIVTDCVCDPYVEKSSVSALGNVGMFLMILLTSLFSLLFFREEAL